MARKGVETPAPAVLTYDENVADCYRCRYRVAVWWHGEGYGMGRDFDDLDAAREHAWSHVALGYGKGRNQVHILLLRQDLVGGIVDGVEH